MYFPPFIKEILQPQEEICTQCAELTQSGDNGIAQCCADVDGAFDMCKTVVDFGPPGRGITAFGYGRQAPPNDPTNDMFLRGWNFAQDRSVQGFRKTNYRSPNVQTNGRSLTLNQNGSPNDKGCINVRYKNLFPCNSSIKIFCMAGGCLHKMHGDIGRERQR